MRIIANQEFASAGTVRVFGASPVENDAILRRMVLVREDQVFPDFKVRHALRAASWFYPNWSGELAETLLARLRPPGQPGDQEALPGDALGARHRDRPGGTGRDHAVRRALRRPGRGGPAAVLRPTARQLRRASPHRGPVHPSDRRGRRPAGAGGDDRPRADRARRRRRRRPRQRHDGERPDRRGGGVRRRAPHLGPPPDRLAGVGGRRRDARRRRLGPGPGAASQSGVPVAATGHGPRRRPGQRRATKERTNA